MFMRGKDAETLEDIILDLMDEAAVRQATDKEGRDQLKSLSRQVRASYQKIGIVKYNAFKGMGGNLSFVIALLDDNNSGFILNSVHSREGCLSLHEGCGEGEHGRASGSRGKEALGESPGLLNAEAAREKLAVPIYPEIAEHKLRGDRNDA